MKRVMVWVCIVFLLANIGLAEEIKSFVEVIVRGRDNLKKFRTVPVEIYGKTRDGFKVIAGKHELNLLTKAGLKYKILVKNIDDFLLPLKKAHKGILADAGKYHTYKEVTQELKHYAETFPEICKVFSIGKTWENRDIWCLKISDNPEIDENEPAILIMGALHAREWISVEVPMYYIKTLIEGYKNNDPKLKSLVLNREIFVVPMCNPDGVTYSQQNYKMWRKNRRDNGDGNFGVDLNRNFGYMWGGLGASTYTGSDTYRGPEAFSEPETKAIRDLALKEKFKGSVSFHSYSQLILWPFGYDYNVPNPKEPILKKIGIAMSKFNGYTPQNSADLYPAAGDSEDWFCGECDMLSYTFELATQFIPPESQIEKICKKNVAALLYFTKIIDNVYPLLSHKPLRTTTDTEGPYIFEVKADYKNNPDLKVKEIKVLYKINNGPVTTAKFKEVEKGKFIAKMPGQPFNTNISYHIEALDSKNKKYRFPETGEYEFRVEMYTRLLVIDDKGKGYKTYYEEALNANKYSFDTWDTAKDGHITEELLKNYNMVIWFTGNDSTSTFSETEQNILSNYLNSGGKLFITGQDIGYDLKNSPFMRNTLKANFVADSSQTKNLKGTDDEIFKNIGFVLDGGDSAQNQKYPSIISPANGAKPAIIYNDGKVAGVHYKNGDSEIIYFAFGFEGISGKDKRNKIMNIIVEALTPFPRELASSIVNLENNILKTRTNKQLYINLKAKVALLTKQLVACSITKFREFCEFARKLPQNSLVHKAISDAIEIIHNGKPGLPEDTVGVYKLKMINELWPDK